MTPSERRKNPDLLKIAGMVAPLIVSTILLAVQWGSVNTKIDLFKESLNKTNSKVEKMSDAMVTIQKDVAFIKGKLKDGGEG